MTLDERVAANTADIDSINKDISALRADVAAWRQQHEHREEGNFNLLCAQINGVEAELKEMRDKLLNRWPVSATILITVAAATIGTLVGVILELSRLLVH